MPKREADPADPMQLEGIPVPAAEETLLEKTECFVDEFLLLGHRPEEVLAIFMNPFYAGAHQLVESLGERRVRETIDRRARAFRFSSRS